MWSVNANWGLGIANMAHILVPSMFIGDRSVESQRCFFLEMGVR